MKLEKSLLAISLVLASISPISANSLNTLSLTKAVSVMESYIDSRGWNNLKIVNYEKLYDGNLEEYGFVFEMIDGEVAGYGIVINSNNNYFMVEASNEMQSPYYENDNLNNIYVSQLEYYFAPTDSISNDIVIDSITREEKQRSELVKKKFEVNYTINNSRYIPGVERETVIVSSFDTKFEKTIQPRNYGCIAYSSAMMLKYLDNMGTITLDNEVDNISDLGPKLLEYMVAANGTTIGDEDAKRGILNFGNDYTNKSLSFTSSYSSATFEAAATQIDINRPLILMFDYNTLFEARHATTMYGYRVERYDLDSGYSELNYILAIDPGTNPAASRDLLWDDDDILGYFILGIE